ncbi:ent-copalyl diphosphate synthase, chloroplastic-like [Olea europaea subsp. europaea]|uniref:Ent-copalyl diphosphate synthase, chloroplastic-like n=1 Tax=Olea europaea subsp. europaea TaxID=158383 RepID=A0A8S0TDS3_OLEEU|nr:ent-copalyl diphosphate synthase, chloroplastic-like [Olea europaea subsp. europaea]
MGRGDAELPLHTMDLSGRGLVEEQLLTHPKYQQLSEITKRVCHQLRLLQSLKIRTRDENSFKIDMGGITTVKIEAEMQKLVKFVLTKSSYDIDNNTKQTFLAIAKSFYYVTYRDVETINSHIAKVLFETVL